MKNHLGDIFLKLLLIMINRRQLIFGLILQDLSHNQVLLTFKNIGFEDNDHYNLNIYSVIVRIFGLDYLPKVRLHSFYCTYHYYISQSTNYRVEYDGAALIPLAEECYQALKELAEKLKNENGRSMLE